MEATEEEMKMLEESIEKTKRLFSHIISRPKLTSQLLRKPPVKFLRDIFIEVALATGCGRGLFTAEEIENAASSRETKFQFLTMLIHFVSTAIDEPMLIEKVRVSKVAAGLEPENTNLLLQELHFAATSQACQQRFGKALQAAREAAAAGRESAWTATGEMPSTPERKSPDLPDYSTPTPRPALAYAAALKGMTTEPATSSSGKRASGISGSAPPTHSGSAEEEDPAARRNSVQRHSKRLSLNSLSSAGEWVNQIQDARLRYHARKWYEAQPLPREEEHWKKLLLAEGLSGLEDGRLGRLAYSVAQFDKAARNLLEVAKEEGYLGLSNESELGRMILQHIWPSVVSSTSDEAQEAPEPEAECSPEEQKIERSRNHSGDRNAPKGLKSHHETHCVVMSKREYVRNSIKDKQTCADSIRSSLNCPKAAQDESKRPSHRSSKRTTSKEGLLPPVVMETIQSGNDKEEEVEEDVLEDLPVHPFLRACHGQSGSTLIDSVKNFLDKEAFDITQTLDTTGVTALLYATAFMKSPGVVKLLVDRRADVRTSFQGLDEWHGLQPGMTAIEFASARKREHVGHKGVERWEAIEEILKTEVDRLRGWQTGRRNTRQMTWSQHRLKELEARVNAEESSSSGSEASEEDVDMSNLGRNRASNSVSKTGSMTSDMMRSLYHAKAGFLVEHIEAHPSELYDLEDKVGEGTFGSVRKCMLKSTGGVRAMKTLPKMLLEDLSLWSEIGIMRQIDHPHIMKLFQTFEDAHNVYMVCEMCTGGQLFDAIIEAGTFSERLSAMMMKQMLSSVCYLHQRCICHRDLKPENFMLAAPGPLDHAHVKLIDFGTAKRFDLEKMTTKVCTVHYVAPDLLKNQPVPYTEKCDVWSCGVILFVMLSGSPPFVGDTDMEVLKKVKKGIYHFTPKAIWSQISEDAHRMVTSMLTVKVKDRYSAERAAKDNWVLDLAPHAKEVRLTEKRVLDKMRAFHAFNKLKKVALQVIAQQLSDESIALLRQMFMALDPQMKGALMIDKMEEAVTKLSQSNEVDADQAVELIQMMHEMAGTSGEINYTQFLAANIDKQHYLKEEACKAAFALFDVDGDGEISREDLKALFANQEAEEDADEQDAADAADRDDEDKGHLGQHAMEILGCNFQEIERIMTDCDADGNGAISFDEFMTMMAQKDIHQPADMDFSLLQQEMKSPAGKFAEKTGARTTRNHHRHSNAEEDEAEKEKAKPTSQLQRSPTQILRQKRQAEQEEAVASSAPNTSRTSLTGGSSPTKGKTTDDAQSVETPKPKSKMVKSSTVIFGKRGNRLHGQVSGGDAIPQEDHPDGQAPDTRPKGGAAGADASRGDVRSSIPEDTAQLELQGPNPLWEVLQQKQIDIGKLEECLKGEGGKYVNCHLHKEQSVPPALFFAVVNRSMDMVKLLIAHRTDVRRKYDGEKPWRIVKLGQTPQDVNESQKGRFKGTVLGERCEAIGTLMKAEEDRLRGWHVGRRASTAAKRYFQREGNTQHQRFSLNEVETEEQATLKLLAESKDRLMSKTEEAMSKKTLYSAEATFVCEHIDGNPGDVYSIGAQVGEGTFGSVCKVRNKQTNLERAMKSVPKTLLEESDLWQEIELMREIDHPYITRLYGTYEDSENIFMIMECCDGGELFDAIENAGCFVENTSARIFHQMLIAICYLHHKGICHRDLKPENFLLLNEGPVERTCVKLIDFGTARRFGPGHPMTTKICTIHYVAPEILARNADSYTEKCDCWSLGVCLYLMLSGSPPFCADTDTQVLKKVRKGKFKFEPEFFWDSIDEGAKNLVSSMLVVDASARLSANDALNHRWFRCIKRREVDPKDLASAVPKLLQFTRHSWFKQKSMEMIANQLPESSCEDLRDIFLQIDTSHCGKVRHVDLARAIPANAEDPRFMEDREKLLNLMEKKGSDGEVRYTTFLAALLDPSRCLDEAACKSAFSLLDLDDDGMIRITELLLILQSHRMDEEHGCDWEMDVEKCMRDMDAMSAKECEEVLTLYDHDKDQALDYREFVGMLQSSVY